MGARNLRCVSDISDRNRARRVSFSLLLGIAYHDVGAPAGVGMKK